MRLARFVVVATLLACGLLSGVLAAGIDDVNTPAIPKDRGIYLAKEGNTLTALVQARIAGMKTAGGLKAMVSGGITRLKMKYQVRGDRADIRTGEQPTFYISGIEPADLTVLKLETKGKEREFVASTMGGLTGGIRAPDGAAEFKAEKLEGGYKLTFATTLKAGEYGFTYVPGGSPIAVSTVFDFGVDAGSQ